MYREETNRKIQIYFAANYLFAMGKSFPQAIEILSQHETNNELLQTIVEQARVDHWREIFNEVQILTAEGKPFYEIIQLISPLEPDGEIVHFIATTWYEVKTAYVDHFLDGSANIHEGSIWTIIAGIGVIAVFYFNGSIIIKVALTIHFLVALLTLLLGLIEKRTARNLKKILEQDYLKFGDLI